MHESPPPHKPQTPHAPHFPITTAPPPHITLANSSQFSFRGAGIPWVIYLLICVLCLPVMIHLSLSSGSFSVPQTTGSFRQSKQAGSPVSLEPACPGPHSFSNFLLYFCRCPCFPDSSPGILFICLLTSGLCLSWMSHPSQSSGSFSVVQTTAFCPIFFSFITPFKLLPLLLVAQQYLIAICHSL